VAIARSMSSCSDAGAVTSSWPSTRRDTLPTPGTRSLPMSTSLSASATSSLSDGATA